MQEVQSETDDKIKNDSDYKAQFDRDIIVTAFRILTEIENLHIAIPRLLDSVGKRFSLDGIMILERTEDGAYLDATFDWYRNRAQENVPEVVRFPYDSWVALEPLYNTDGLMIVPDSKKLPQTDSTRILLETLDVRAILSCAMKDGAEFKGFIGMNDRTGARAWSPDEKETLLLITKIIASYLFRMRSTERAEAMVNRLTNYDKITGLMKLEKFKDSVAAYLKADTSSQCYGMIYSDIINFKYVNDRFGYQEGDLLLAKCADCFAGESIDCIYASRAFSDFFVCFVRVESPVALLLLVREQHHKFLSVISERYPNGNLKICAGAYIMDSREDNVSQAIDNANIARKSVKNTALSYALYNGALHDRIMADRLIESEMQEALECGEFRPYLQPKYDLITGAIVGCEALARWIKPDGRVVYPDAFIPLFERNGFIEKLDFFMLRTICQQLRMLLNNDLPAFPVSINQSRYLLYNDEYVDNVKQIIEEFSIPTELIELELTESLFFEDSKKIIEVLHALKAYGVRISIDDFGSGYSSLNLLKELPVDVLKIDKGFLSEAENSQSSKIIIEKVVGLAKGLNIKVICEGVETEDQAGFLRSIFCDMAQGYLYARPMPMEQFNDMMGALRLHAEV